MQQKGQLKCTCISGFFSSQQKWFLTQKKESEELDSPVHQRKNNRSAEIKCQSQIKSHKKSLKKRQNSNVSSDGHLHQPINLQEHQIQSQLKIHFEPESPNKRQYFTVLKVYDSLISQKNNVYNPISTKHVNQGNKNKQTNHFLDSRNHFIFPQGSNLQQQNHSIKLIHQENLALQTNQNDINIHHQQYFNSNILNSPSVSGAKNDSINDYEYYKLYPSQHIQKIHYPEKIPQKETQSWMPAREESLIIEEFDRLFKNKQQHQSHAQLNTDNKHHLKIRDAKKSKRHQKHLIGRFAQSDGDDDACSDPASEVIGKGFENHFEAFWDFDEPNHIQKTLITRSTNTKGSEPLKFNNNLPQFGAANHFKSYKFL